MLFFVSAMDSAPCHHIFPDGIHCGEKRIRSVLLYSSNNGSIRENRRQLPMEYRKEYGSCTDMPEDMMLRGALSDTLRCSCSQNGRPGQSCPTVENRGRDSGCGCSNGSVNRCSNRSSRQENGSGGPSDDGCMAGSCVAGPRVDPLSGFPLAMAYVPNQPWEGIQEPEDALSGGTLFTGLLFPWHPSRCGASQCGSSYRDPSHRDASKGCGCGRN